MLKRLLARLFFALSGWKLASEPAPGRPVVFLGAPHTSNWDFPLTLAVAWSLGIEIRWLGKKSLFKGVAGPIARRLGGIPVDRENPQGLVDDLVAQMRSGATFGLVIAPDGTRSGNTHWKSGFYRIARDAGLDVSLGFVDGPTKTTGLGPTITLTGDVRADMDVIRAFYADKHGYHPEQRVEPRLREESTVDS
ncbi:1-acyl-sn-glycerol-3-phosphate acyltransferase [Nocardioides yefusunii]|uniref:1-acyl-sn-glycerol-3-phosphate acyltransferase n=1 Tax=Nocardioides yefusunii TaxID=2500546 RepID=A0ABW1QVR1_9ACTN|nr:1-acyl-sn-glycerol-3-phosphate acyltransferase [Nocardioides yefusunii]